MLGKKYLAEKKYEDALNYFILAQVPEEEGGSASSANRNIQVYYYIGLAYDALGNKSSAKKYFTLASDNKAGASGYMRYHQGLSYLKLGKTSEASEIFNSLVEDGKKQISQSSNNEDDFFAKFGAREAENTRRSQAYLLRGAGYKGLGKTDLAAEDLKKAVELSVSNLWARSELQDL